MPDKITIIIERDGTVVDQSTAELGIGPTGVPILDLLTAAFADAYGTHSVDQVEANPYRNVSYHVRQHMTTVTLGYTNKQIDLQAAAQKQAVADAALQAVTVVE
jgi:hypothetical protein